jgi:hypothetical protein
MVESWYEGLGKYLEKPPLDTKSLLPSVATISGINFVALTLVIYGQEAGNIAKNVLLFFPSLETQSPSAPTPESPEPKNREMPRALSCAKPLHTDTA